MSQRHRVTSREYLDLEQEVRQKRRGLSDQWLMAGILVVPVLLLGVFELGRIMLYTRDIRAFTATIDQRSPADIKRDLHRYAAHLSDWNPAIRGVSIMPLKLATGWNPGNTPGDWRQMWMEQEPYWDYRRANTNAPAPDWRANLPEKVPAP